MPNAARQDRFLELLQQHKGILWKVAGAYGRSEADRQDLVQETTAQLWRSFPRFDERLRFSTWMYRIALNVAISWQRRESTRARHTVHAEDAILQVAAQEEGSAALEEDLRLLHEAVAGLNELDRAIVLLWVDGRSYAGIGEVLGISATNAGTRLSRIKERLRRDVRAAANGRV